MSDKDNVFTGMPRVLLEEMKDNPAVQKLNAGKGPLPLASFIEEALVIAASYRMNPRPILVIKNNLYNAQRLFERLSSLLTEKECALFSADESLRVEAIAGSPETIANKVDTLASLLNNPNQVVVTCLAGVLRHLPSPDVYRKGCMEIHVGDQLEMEDLKRNLRAAGYYQAAHIDQPLSFAARGGIVDLYSINYDQPVRIEFFDDEIESIRFFDADTQKTVVLAEEIKIVPASDLLFTEENIEEILRKSEELLEKENDIMLSSSIEADLDLLKQNIREPRLYPYTALLSENFGLWDYMNNPLILVSDEDTILDSNKRLITETTSYIQEMVQEKKLLPKYTMWHDFSRIAPKSRRIIEDPTGRNISNIQELYVPNEELELKLRILQEETRVLLCLHDKEVERVLTACVEAKIPYTLLNGEEDKVGEGINILIYDLAEGFENSSAGLCVATANELFEVRRHNGRYEKKFRSAEVIHNYDELEQGDYIVHAQHGVGQYVNIETREIQGTKRDFLRIIYRGNAELLVPLEQFKLVRKFVSREGVVPKLNKLGSDEWTKTKQRLEENVTNIAERLVSLYATREEHIGHAFQPDSELQAKFESEFDYELTPDQAQAVIDVKKDMESDKPMDRLICGDVGFGKTEIAVRASFKAAAENKQVAVLCPTTILAEQHYHTFSKRFRGYPFDIRVLNRFATAAQVKETLEDLKTGKVDVLIGTHRILSKDVEFKDLGLLVVDEEQRFGVEHKEKIKELKNSVDVLTLSATPIPRTLQMSLIGIRQLSRLETPPTNRFNVQTYVVEKNAGLVTDAVEKELARDGQVFYLFNNIEHIYNIARKLQHEVKDARIGIVHGKMERDAIEEVMRKFNDHELNVLVCTTIIENGIDVPNANTILIENAQDFGLAQIYQIKGRVGRGDRVAYAYLMVPPRKQLNETAQKRLQAVKDFARMGSGYKIAMRDLTIRGAGDLLGANQSGFIDTVGIDMYIEMLEEAIAKKKGEVVEKKELAKHAIVSENSYIPEKFAPDDFDKIKMYQNIDAIVSMEELDDYRSQVEDQYGHLPDEVDKLFMKKNLDILLNSGFVQSYKEIKGKSEVVFTPEYSSRLNGVKLFEMYTKISKDIELRYKNQSIIAYIPKQKDGLAQVLDVINKSQEAIKE